VPPTPGVATIDYDRLTLGWKRRVLRVYDNTKVGELQGPGSRDCLGDKPANIVFLNGAPTDNNATLFSQGAHSVLRPDEQYKQVA
jgi:D-xylose transport system substrate-binding protein